MPIMTPWSIPAVCVRACVHQSGNDRSPPTSPNVLQEIPGLLDLSPTRRDQQGAVVMRERLSPGKKVSHLMQKGIGGNGETKITNSSFIIDEFFKIKKKQNGIQHLSLLVMLMYFGVLYIGVLHYL